MQKLKLLTRSLFTVATLNVLVASEPQKPDSDLAIRQRVVGPWIVDSHSPNGASFHGTMTIVSGSNFISKATMTFGEKKQELNFEGTWQVKNGFLIETVTKSGSKFPPVGLVTRDNIIRVDDQELVFKTEQGKTVTRKRSRDT